MQGLSDGCDPDNHISGGVESLRIALAAELSAEMGRPVNPPEVPSDFTTRTEAHH